MAFGYCQFKRPSRPNTPLLVRGPSLLGWRPSLVGYSFHVLVLSVELARWLGHVGYLLDPHRSSNEVSNARGWVCETRMGCGCMSDFWVSPIIMMLNPVYIKERITII